MLSRDFPGRNPVVTTLTVPDALQQVIDAGFPREHGTLATIFVRPATNERRELEEARVTARSGVEGDRWRGRNRRTQITLMNAAVLDCVARGDRARWATAGDQLIVDLDLSEEHLPVGQKLRIGEALVEVTNVPHTGCAKFSSRYGEDVLSFINAPERRHLRLRGCYVRVLVDGVVRVGDRIEKIGDE